VAWANSQGGTAGFRELLYADRAFKTSADPEFYFDALLWKLIG